MNEGNLVITEYFSQIAHKFSGRVCLQIKKGSVWERWTYGQLEEWALKVAGFLIAEKALKKGDFACLILENRPEWPAVYLGILRAGLSCVPLDPQISSDEIKNLILDSGAKIVFTSCEIFAQKVKQAIEQADVEVVVLESDEIKIKNTSYKNINWPEVNPDDIASLIYTSGTTGKPKGVMLTHKNICSNFLSIKELKMCFPSDNFLSILPLHHSYPFMGNLIMPLFIGATVTYLPSGFRLQELSRLIKEAQVTLLVGVPQLFSLLHAGISERLKHIPVFLRLYIFVRKKVPNNFGKTLRLLISGGARLEPKIARDLTKWGLKIIEGYGLTETSPIVTLNPFQKVKFGSVGKSIPSVQIRILNPQSSGIGQILIKGPNVMKGYFKQPDLTAEVLKDDWFYSGDLGYIDKEGYLFVTGREKEVIVLSSGKTIYPEELEAYYSQSPYIKEICVLQKSEERFGHLIDSLFAVVVPNLEYFQQKNVINIHTKIRWELENLAKVLPNYRHIMGFALTKEALDRTAIGKIKRYEVREKYLFRQPTLREIEEAELCEEDKGILSQDFTQKIMQYLSVQLKKPIYLDSHLEIDLGIDSLTRVELGLGLEALLSLKIPDEVLYDVSTVRDVIIRIHEIIQNSKPYGAKVIQKGWAEILREESREEILQKIRIKPRVIDWVLTYIFKSGFKFIFRIFWLLRIKAVDNLPKDGPYLICPNHASFLDGFVIFSSLPLKLAINTYFVGFSYIFEYPLVKWALKLARLLPINPDINLTDTLQVVSYLLSHKKIVCIFPEGLRSVDENAKEFKKGVGILIKELDIPVVPVYIKGSHQSWPRTSLLPKPYPLKVIFGKPLFAKQLGDDYETIAKELREKVLRLIPKNAKS
jgi:long-chain acyl-CoA synthetase